MLSFSALALESCPFCPALLVENSWPLPATALLWVWDAGAPQLAIGVPQTGILSQVRHLPLLHHCLLFVMLRAYPLSLYLASCYEACTVLCA
jgi:hypothetical protein